MQVTLTQRHQFLGAGRMNRHGIVKIALARPHPHGHREALQHLIGTGTDDVTADDPLLRAGAHQLHRRFHRPRRETVVHGGEPGLINPDRSAVLMTGGRAIALKNHYKSNS